MRFLDEGRQAAAPSGALWHDDVKLNRRQQGAGPRGDQGCLYRPRSERRRSPLYANYRQHNPQIPNDPAAIKALLGYLSRAFKYEAGRVMADGDYVSIHGRYTWWRLPPEQHRYARAKNLLV